MRDSLLKDLSMQEGWTKSSNSENSIQPGEQDTWPRGITDPRWGASVEQRRRPFNSLDSRMGSRVSRPVTAPSPLGHKPIGIVFSLECEG